MAIFNYTAIRRLATLAVVALGVCIQSSATAEPTAPDGALLREAAIAADKNDSRGAVALLDRYLAAAEKSPNKDTLASIVEAHFLRGREHFRLAHIDSSIADLDQVAKLAPDRERELWERGISDYYAGKFAAGAKQFELYQTFHDNDVENSTWRYLCIARSDGVDKARASLLPIKNDRRVPMMQIFALYEGKLKPEDVLAAAKAGDPSEAELKPRLFYAHLYIGLWHEAAGDAKAAREHLALAANKYRITHYMGDVARVHVELLDKAAKADKKSKAAQDDANPAAQPSPAPKTLASPKDAR